MYLDRVRALPARKSRILEIINTVYSVPSIPRISMQEECYLKKEATALRALKVLELEKSLASRAECSPRLRPVECSILPSRNFLIPYGLRVN